MKKTTLMTVSLAAAAALAMTGCGSSSGTSSNPTPAPTATPAPTPAPTNTPAPTPAPTPDYAKPAPVNATSVQQLLQPANLATVQVSNFVAAPTASVTGLVSSLITEAMAMTITNTYQGDVPCSVFGATQGSGTIHVETSTQGAGNAYTIDFNECKFDTANTLAVAKSEYVSDACYDVMELSKELVDENLTVAIDGNETEGIFPGLADAATECSLATQKNLDGVELEDLMGELVRITGLDPRFDEKAQEIGLEDALNDTFVITGSLEAVVNLTATPAGNIWDTTFAAKSLDMTLFENESTFKKFEAKLNGELTANLNVQNSAAASSFHIDGTNNLSSTAMIDSVSNNWHFDFGIIGQNTAYAVDADQARDTTQVGWRALSETNVNDSGDGYIKAYFDDNAANYHGEVSLYNKNFAQTRKVVTDPSAVDATGIARKSTYTINGAYGLNTQGLPFVWNTQGAFTYNTSATMTKTKLNGEVSGPYDYAVTGGEYSVTGTAPIDFQFLPDAAANNTDGVQDGSVVVRVGSDLFTLPMNIVTWLEVFPQP